MTQVTCDKSDTKVTTHGGVTIQRPATEHTNPYDVESCRTLSDEVLLECSHGFMALFMDLLKIEWRQRLYLTPYFIRCVGSILISRKTYQNDLYKKRIHGCIAVF